MSLWLGVVIGVVAWVAIVFSATGAWVAWCCWCDKRASERREDELLSQERFRRWWLRP